MPDTRLQRLILLLPTRVPSLFVVCACVASACDPGASSPPPSHTTAGEIVAVPLARRETASGGFQNLPSEQTGVDFVHIWKPPKRYESAIDNAFAGGGVCVGDYDQDGLPDLFLTRPQGGHRLFRNRGQLRFEDVTERTGLSDEEFWGTGAAFADVDGDGALDLYVCAYNSPNRLYVNRGDGSFAERAADAALAFSGASVMMAFADYDLDGDLDGYLVTNRVALPLGSKVQELSVQIVRGTPVVVKGDRELKDVLRKPDGSLKAINAGQVDRLFRNDGDGTFTDVSCYEAD